MLAERGPEALRLLADVAQRPRLPEADLARVKATLARELAIQKSTPQSIAAGAIRGLTYGDHPYGRLFPTEAMLAGYTLDEVRRVPQGLTSAPRRARLYVAGVFDAARNGSGDPRCLRGVDRCGAEATRAAGAARPRRSS